MKSIRRLEQDVSQGDTRKKKQYASDERKKTRVVLEARVMDPGEGREGTGRRER